MWASPSSNPKSKSNRRLTARTETEKLKPPKGAILLEWAGTPAGAPFGRHFGRGLAGTSAYLSASPLSYWNTVVKDPLSMTAVFGGLQLLFAVTTMVPDAPSSEYSVTFTVKLVPSMS